MAVIAAELAREAVAGKKFQNGRRVAFGLFGQRQHPVGVFKNNRLGLGRRGRRAARDSGAQGGGQSKCFDSVIHWLKPFEYGVETWREL